ncbi:hypothetical protein Q4554_15410 [Leptospira santarosai]|uniref:hypothetical protein n=1 Tax=Leptospira santarosai TaxID=28183 RepID=UPI0026E37A33|nr:hypothetical protein [Leptospira santarosai]MDO6395465.1 hypothetical protein [Leptospira santarosai]
MEQSNTLQISDLLKLVQLEDPNACVVDSDGNAYDYEDLLARIPELYDEILLTTDDYHMAMQLIVMAAFSVGWLSKLDPETVKMLARDRYADQSPWAHQTGNATA